MPTCTEVPLQVLSVELYSLVFVSSELEYKDRDYPFYLENMAPPLVDLNDAMQAVCKVRAIERFLHVLEMMESWLGYDFFKMTFNLLSRKSNLHN